MSRKNKKITMLPSVGTPPVDEAARFVIDLLIQERNGKEQNASCASSKNIESS